MSRASNEAPAAPAKDAVTVTSRPPVTWSRGSAAATVRMGRPKSMPSLALTAAFVGADTAKEAVLP